MSARRSPADVRARLRGLADRIPRIAPDPYAIAMRRLGIDAPTPAEAVLRDRLVRGGYRSRGLLPDALLIATVETGVGVWVTDADQLRIEGGELVGAGLRVPLFTTPPRPSSSRVTLFGVVVPGVAAGVVEEAVWIAADLIE
ncbi:hypothetical protein [Solirubrobacter deserti]|uniref:Uncharacterized protein n=1 Tax=Solirubrobacter deserti TaxID=2282478 RepID=A0ABT4RG48_9ACTN|nr:hypothetical protein [Solirubrobacter deserti]MDA0137508.1 hypothetical protein [Solirubrobacter deserti]